ncbi:MAG: DUF2505 domain-containing protein [Actinobacteria bacterium]|nr:DUF2505 domain-containing protein [Actinomycetota bacterium]
MATKLSATVDFPAKAATVFAMFSDSSYLKMKCAQSEQGTFEVSELPSESIICVERSLDEIPDTYQKFLGSDLMIKEEQRWKLDQATVFHGELKISIEGKPIRLAGTLLLSDIENGSRLNIDAEVVVSIPLFGGMAENFIREHFSAVIADEQAIGLQWLSSHK